MEIFYCHRCGARVRSSDFASGAARSSDRVACRACAPAGAPSSPVPEPRDPAILPEGDLPARPRRRVPFWAAGAGLSALALGALALRDPEAPPEIPEEARAALPPPAEPARDEIDLARDYAAEHPDDLEGRLRRFRRLAWELDGTPAGDEALREADALRDEREERLNARLAELDLRLDPLLRATEWADARALLDAERGRDPHPRWSLALDARLRTIEEAERETLTTAAPPAPDVVSEAAIRAWSEACRLAFSRDYAAAEALLRKALDGAAGEAERRELRDDLARLGEVRRFYEDARTSLRTRALGAPLTLHIWDEQGRIVPRKGRLLESRVGWLVVRFEGSRHPEAVDELDIAARSWIEEPGGNPRAAALFSAIEGDVESARRLAVLPGKLDALRPPPGPPRDGRPVAAANERLARRRLVEADSKFGFLATRAEAVLLYRSLLEDYGDTDVVDAHRPVLRERAEAAVEFRLAARELRASGAFRRSSWKGRKVDVPDAWTSSEDVGFRESLDNCVELDFPALPGRRYRCWVYVGGCCLESFTFHFQASEYAARDPDSGKVLAAPPGGTYAFPLEPKGFFRSRHAGHARRGAPKRPERWQWIEVPLPEFSEAGLKTVRLLTAQQGFSVACAVVSSRRDAAPGDAEALEILTEAEAEIAGAAEPSEWLLYGPLPRRSFGAVDEPQRRLDASDEGWIPASAELRPAGGGRAAVFDFAARWTPNEDVAALALLHVRSPEARDARLLLGSDDGVEAWLNDELVHRLDRGRGVKLDEDRVDVRLQAGWNRLLIKVYQGKGGWGLAARVAHRSGRPMTDLAYDAWGRLPGVLR